MNLTKWHYIIAVTERSPREWQITQISIFYPARFKSRAGNQAKQISTYWRKKSDPVREMKKCFVTAPKWKKLIFQNGTVAVLRVLSWYTDWSLTDSSVEERESEDSIKTWPLTQSDTKLIRAIKNRFVWGIEESDTKMFQKFFLVTVQIYWFLLRNNPLVSSTGQSG